MTNSSSRLELDGGIRAEYRRSYGLHNFTTSGGDDVSVASAPNWKDYIDTVEDNVSNLSEVVLSPELITTGLDIERIALSTNLRSEVRRRVKKLRAISKKAPDTTFLLGTAQYDRNPRGTTNSLLGIQNGKVTSRADKYYVTPGSAEQLNFRQSESIGFLPAMGRSALVVCSDILPIANPAFARSKPSLAPNVDTLLMSACWANPMEVNGVTVPDSRPDEVRFRTVLEWCITRAFAEHPNLNDIVISDRKPPGSQIDGPLNGHFYRS